MASNFGNNNKDIFAKNYFIRGTILVDEYKNISANSLTLSNNLILSGNLTSGNLMINNLISTNRLAANDIMGNVTGRIFDEMDNQVVGVQAPPEPDPPLVTPFFPTGVLLPPPPIFPLPPLASPGPPPPPITPNSNEHIFLYNIINLQNEVSSLRNTVVGLLNKLRVHGLIGV